MCIFASIYTNIKKNLEKWLFTQWNVIKLKTKVIVYAYFNEEHKGIYVICRLINYWSIAVGLSLLFINRMIKDIQSNCNYLR